MQLAESSQIFFQVMHPVILQVQWRKLTGCRDKCFRHGELSPVNSICSGQVQETNKILKGPFLKIDQECAQYMRTTEWFSVFQDFRCLFHKSRSETMRSIRYKWTETLRSCFVRIPVLLFAPLALCKGSLKADKSSSLSKLDDLGYIYKTILQATCYSCFNKLLI